MLLPSGAQEPFMLDGPTMQRMNPFYYANEMIEAWTCREPMPMERFHGLARELSLIVTDSIVEIGTIDDEADTPLRDVTFFAARGCEIIHEKGRKVPVTPEDPEDAIFEAIEFKSTNDGPITIMAVNIGSVEPNKYQFELSECGSIRFAFSREEDRDSVLAALLDITGFKLVEEEENIYAGREKDTGDIDWGTVIYANDIAEDNGLLLHWVELTTNL